LPVESFQITTANDAPGRDSQGSSVPDKRTITPKRGTTDAGLAENARVPSHTPEWTNYGEGDPGPTGASRQGYSLWLRDGVPLRAQVPAGGGGADQSAVSTWRLTNAVPMKGPGSATKAIGAGTGGDPGARQSAGIPFILDRTFGDPDTAGAAGSRWWQNSPTISITGGDPATAGDPRLKASSGVGQAGDRVFLRYNHFSNADRHGNGRSPGAGGQTSLPEVGDQVLMGFEQGDRGRTFEPALISEATMPPPDAQAGQGDDQQVVQNGRTARRSPAEDGQTTTVGAMRSATIGGAMNTGAAGLRSDGELVQGDAASGLPTGKRQHKPMSDDGSSDVAIETLELSHDGIEVESEDGNISPTAALSYRHQIKSPRDVAPTSPTGNGGAGVEG
jgi:hypothetical protein